MKQHITVVGAGFAGIQCPGPLDGDHSEQRVVGSCPFVLEGVVSYVGIDSVVEGARLVTGLDLLLLGHGAG